MTASLANVGVQLGFSGTDGEQISKIRKRIMLAKITMTAISGAELGGSETCRLRTFWVCVFDFIFISEAENRLRAFNWREAHKKSMRLVGLQH